MGIIHRNLRALQALHAFAEPGNHPQHARMRVIRVDHRVLAGRDLTDAGDDVPKEFLRLE